jgi:hyperosmotically inducible periplasmic protein
MTRYLTVLLCITGAAALACSKDKPAESAYDTTVRPADETPLTPASSDSTGDHTVDHSNHAASDRTMSGESTGTTAGSTTVAPDRSSAADTIPPRDDKDGGDSMRSTAPNTDSSKKADNTARNERDRNDSAVTPIDQGNSQSDLDITQRIRQAVMKDDTLSFTAKNVKIITRDGKVVLRGAVKSYEERLAIESAAKNVAGQGNVQSELEVKK